MRQIRLCFYLDPGDARYGEHSVVVPVIPLPNEPGWIDLASPTLSEEEYSAWRDGLPKKKRTNPFHNHFIRVQLDAKDEDIAAIADRLLAEFYEQWSGGDIVGGRDV